MKKMTILSSINKSKKTKGIALGLALTLFFQTALPTVSYALTSGPGQPEYASFEPASTSDMVDLYSGSFTYNIPLLSVPGPNGGYPINIAYHSGVTMDEEASWVGLGWNLNVGAINRQLQGLPDDFKGDQVLYKVNQKKPWSVGIDVPTPGPSHQEAFGYPTYSGSSTSAWGTPWNVNVYFNNYRGLGYRVSPTLNAKHLGKADQTGLTASIGLSFDSQNGIGINPSISTGKNVRVGLTAGYNSHRGLTGINFTMSPDFIARKLATNKKANSTGAFIKAVLEASNDKELSQAGKAWGNLILTQTKNVAFASSGISYSYGGQLTNIGVETKTNYFPITIRAVGSSAGPLFTANRPFNIWSGMFSMTSIPESEYTDAAYGYAYGQDGFVAGNDNVVRDFTRKEIDYSKKVPYLSPSKNTYDIFTFSGQGTGGFFRPYKTGVEVLSQKKKQNTTVTNNITTEFGTTGTSYHVGIGYNRSKGTHTTGDWDASTNSTDEFDIHKSTQLQMRLAGEHTGILYNDDNLNLWGSDQAVRNNIGHNFSDLGREYKLESELVRYQGGSTVVDYASNANLAYSRMQDNRNTSVKYLTYAQAHAYGFSKNLTYNDVASSNPNQIKDTKPSNHISEIIVTQPEGSKYVYGLPVYNTAQKEYSYNTATTYSATDPVDDLASGTDPFSAVEALGINYTQYYNRASTPQYAYSWLLTGVVAADYIDVDQNGISENDKGYWVKFNYSKYANDFAWRVPYRGAKMTEGGKGNEYDNIASFSYGTKEIYYVNKIETKTHVAVFELEDREDALEAFEEFVPKAATYSGASAVQKQKLLKRIKLYAKDEYEEMGTAATPLQVVHFEYDYSLCPNVPNNTGASVTVGGTNINAAKGKLTLKKIYFTYEKSNKGALSPYEFTYSSNNFAYNELAVDRWGNYKDISSSGGYPYERFPYTEQNTAPTADVWHLTSIKLPTGGDLNITYESNDYAYVEEERAMQMFDIVGIGNAIDGSEIMTSSNTATSDHAWYSTPIGSASVGSFPTRTNSPCYANLRHEKIDNDGYRIYFQLDKTYPTGDFADATARASFVKNEFLLNKTKIWFKNLTTLKNSGGFNFDDYVEGYVDLTYGAGTGNPLYDYVGLCKSSSSATGYDVGYFTVVREPLQENGLGLTKANPMAKLALQHMRMNRDDINYQAFPVPSGSGVAMVSSVLSAMPTFITEVYSMLASYNVAQFSLGHCKFIRLNGHSKVRLYDEDGHKYGGGSRVKKLAINDNWASGTTAVSGENGVYGQKYVYNLSGIDGDLSSLSSGVAYEPFVGAEESALRQPIDYVESTPLKSAYSLFVEKPVLDFYYPGASIGYSKVTVYSLGKEQALTEGVASADINHNSAATASIYEFFTPKDFPIYSDETDINPEQAYVVPIVIPGIYSYMETKKARSQGYSIVLNDMAGKMKKTSQVKVTNTNEPLGGILSSVEYVYKTQTAYSENGGNKLTSTVQVLVPNSSYEPELRTGILGQTVDIHQDRHEDRYTEIGWGLEGNLEFGTMYIFPPTIFPSFEQTETAMRTVTLNKVIHRSGILVKTVAKTDQSVIESENLAFDMYTGEPILMSTNNEYDDKKYTFSYPAHWYYQNLKPVQQNDYLSLTGAYTNNGSGKFTVPSVVGQTYDINDFVVGDELYVTTGTGSVGAIANNLAYVANIDYANNWVWLVDRFGQPLGGSIAIDNLQMRSSGYKNMQAAKSGAIEFKELNGYSTAMLTGATYATLSFGKILNATAIEFGDNWQSDCSDCEERSSDEVNPFLTGIKNQWRVKKSYAYKTERVYNGNSRTEGHFDAWTRFKWENASLSEDKWILGNTVTKYSPYGFELENKDPLENFTSAQYGYKNTMLISLAANSRYAENTNENFEDYYAGKDCYKDKMLECVIPGIDASVLSTIITSAQKHTGKYALVTNSTYNSIPFEGKAGNLTNCDQDEAQTKSKTVGTEDPTYTMDDCDCLGGMKLQTEKKYVFSAWTKVVKTWTEKPYTYAQAKVEVQFYDGSGTAISSGSGGLIQITASTKNKIIEGWQRLYAEFTVPATAASFKVTFMNNDANPATASVYYDDIRIHPFDGNMQTYVYDASNFKLLAELDANNYATFYAYDEEGNLIHLKKETIEGIKTISEGRKELRKK